MFRLTTINQPADVPIQTDDGLARAGTLGVVVAGLMAILVLIL